MTEKRSPCWNLNKIENRKWNHPYSCIFPSSYSCSQLI
uniref:Uncharacterized protein n=1 Tax=Lepeophtheirus salmonis TaxID=72036 RepID=A0A0K2TA11_LEPSM